MRCRCSGIHAAFGAARQQVAQFGGETDGAQRRRAAAPAMRRDAPVLDVAREQVPDDAVLLGAGDQARWRITLALCGQPQHRERVGVHRAHQRLTHGNPARQITTRRQQRGGQGAARLRAQPAGTGEQQHRLGVGARRDPRGGGVDEQAGLARARPAEHTNDTPQAGVEHRRSLGGPGAGTGDREGARIGDRCGRDHVGMTAQGSDKSADPLHVHRFGPPGPPQVLAIHGLTGHGRRWQTLADGICPRWRWPHPT